jgi:hypothetical protein
MPIMRKKRLRTAKSTMVDVRVGTGCHAFMSCYLKVWLIPFSLAFEDIQIEN